MNKGLFITFEGPDGCGKTTVCKMVYDRLVSEGIEAIHTREPGGIEIAEQIRNVILDPKNTMMDARTEALLYAASRRQHLVERVIPAMNAGKVVVCERFVDSSLAYQGCGRELGFEAILEINEFAIEGLYPNKTIYLDVSEEVGLARIKDRDFKDRLDQESVEFHKRVNDGYKKVVETFKDRIEVIDASRPLEEVVEAAYKAVKELIND